MTAYTTSDHATPAPDPTAPSDIAHLVGARTQAIRRGQGMSRRALAELAGVSERYLSMLEKGNGNVSILLLDRIAHALGVRLSELVADESPTT